MTRKKQTSVTSCSVQLWHENTRTLLFYSHKIALACKMLSRSPLTMRTTLKYNSLKVYLMWHNLYSWLSTDTSLSRWTQKLSWKKIHRKLYVSWHVTIQVYDTFLISKGLLQIRCICATRVLTLFHSKFVNTSKKNIV